MGLGADDRRTRVLAYAAIAAAIAMVTPIVRASHAVDALPLWLQWYVRPFGEFTIFTLFPVGRVRVRRRRGWRR